MGGSPFPELTVIRHMTQLLLSLLQGESRSFKLKTRYHNQQFLE